MQIVKIKNTTRSDGPVIRAAACRSFLCQFKGLMFRRFLAADEGLLLVQKRDSRLDASIHMFFMRIDLAVIWIDSAGQVVDVRLAQRWHPAYLPAKPARYILETSKENLDVFRIGDYVQFTYENTA